ncbi:DUF1054 domain-containing protein [Latilactobacillus graminis]|uniref:UPF0637 protein FC90_GL000894 n=2 Tax=Latilactobacillus graminis TaxID=60519 RepID=A0AA89KX32_9LACO|nr:DUF1054 domain-containing protein [Latilactobacillus graminis]KRM22295.1 hypothetical protein FC90_GL000894 [Latilactobacillus graminis DSM 20719]QFP79529.1 DUF1054 domain-containing protein [Latilactobacillus graminis]
MFTRADFKVFADPTLKGRLHKIYTELDPKFETLGEQLQTMLAQETDREWSLHIAKHLRRSKNPPMNTWLALSESSRGYKMLPHFEIGFWDDRIFVWFALMAEMPNKLDYVPVLAAQSEKMLKKFADYDLSYDHMTKQKFPLSAENLQLVQTKFAKTKKGEWLLGKVYYQNNRLFDTPNALMADIQTTLLQMVPLYTIIQAK